MLRLIGTIGHLVNPITMVVEVKIVSVLTIIVPTKDNGLISCVNMLDKSFVKKHNKKKFQGPNILYKFISLILILISSWVATLNL